jgi:CRISPR-associated protein (TIGR03984 family)
MKANKINTVSTPIKGAAWRDHLPSMEGASVIAWLFDKQISGQMVNGALSMESNILLKDEDIIEVRVFTEDKELYIRDVNGSLEGRLRIDTEGSTSDVIDAANILWGTVTEATDHHIYLTESRGIRLSIPKVYGINDSINIHIRNYIDYDSVGAASYVDARFLKFEKIQ